MATVVRAWFWWPGAEIDVLRLFSGHGIPTYNTETIDEFGEIAIFREVDEQEQETGRVVGLEIVDFLDFDRWEDLPRFEFLWQLPDREPLPLDELLRRVQQELRQQVMAAKG